MNRDATIMVGLALLGGAAAWWLIQSRRQTPRADVPLIDWSDVYVETVQAPAPAPAPLPTTPGPGLIESWTQGIVEFFGFGDEQPARELAKTPAEWRAELRPLFRAQERRYSMPPGLLEAIADRESRFRHDIITGELVGGIGEQGIMQLHPAYHLTPAERLDPYRAIPYAASYLATQFVNFGSWSEAIAAYNWGPGNVRRSGIHNAPAEVKEYVAWVKARDYVGGFA